MSDGVRVFMVIRDGLGRHAATVMTGNRRDWTRSARHCHLAISSTTLSHFFNKPLVRQKKHKGRQRKTRYETSSKKDRESFLSEIFSVFLSSSNTTTPSQSDVSWCLFVDSSQYLNLLSPKTKAVSEIWATSWFGDDKIYGAKCVVWWASETFPLRCECGFKGERDQAAALWLLICGCDR